MGSPATIASFFGMVVPRFLSIGIRAPILEMISTFDGWDAHWWFIHVDQHYEARSIAEEKFSEGLRRLWKVMLTFGGFAGKKVTEKQNAGSL